MTIKVGDKVIAKSREFENVIICGHVAEITTGPVYERRFGESVEVVSKDTVLYDVRALAWVSPTYRGSVYSTLTSDIFPFTEKAWEKVTKTVEKTRSSILKISNKKLSKLFVVTESTKEVP